MRQKTSQLSLFNLGFLKSAVIAVMCCLSFHVVAQYNTASKLGNEKYEPRMGQSGKDVIWIPTSSDLITQMLRTARVNSNDIVYDLGAGDGKIAIAAAKDFGAQSFGIEF